MKVGVFPVIVCFLATLCWFCCDEYHVAGTLSKSNKNDKKDAKDGKSVGNRVNCRHSFRRSCFLLYII